MTPLDWWLTYDGKIMAADARSDKMTPDDYEEMKQNLRDKGIEV